MDQKSISILFIWDKIHQAKSQTDLTALVNFYLDTHWLKKFKFEKFTALLLEQNSKQF